MGPGLCFPLSWRLCACLPRLGLDPQHNGLQPPGCKHFCALCIPNHVHWNIFRDSQEHVLQPCFKLIPGEELPKIDFHGQMWMVTQGLCKIDGKGCIASPGYPSNYSVDSYCAISVNSSSAVPITCRRVSH